MEKQKKKISKKAVVICSIVLAVLLIAGGVFTYKYVTRERLYTFDEITNGLSEQVSYVVDADGVLTQEKIDEFYELYKRVNYVEVDLDEKTIEGIHGRIDKVSVLDFYDENNDMLFEISAYSYNRVFIKTDDAIKKYVMRNTRLESTEND